MRRLLDPPESQSKRLNLRDKVARKASPDGNPFAVWRAMMNVTAAQPDPAMGYDYAASEVVFSEQDFQARYMPTGLAGLVTQERSSRHSIYRAAFDRMNEVLGYLTENCCQGADCAVEGTRESCC